MCTRNLLLFSADILQERVLTFGKPKHIDNDEGLFRSVCDVFCLLSAGIEQLVVAEKRKVGR